MSCVHLLATLFLLPCVASATNFLKDRLKDYSCMSLLVPISEQKVDQRILWLAPIKDPFLAVLKPDPSETGNEEFERRHAWLEWSQMLGHLNSDQFPLTLHELKHYSALNLSRQDQTLPEVWISIIQPSLNEKTGRLHSGEFVIEVQTEKDVPNLIQKMFELALEDSHYNLLTSKSKTEDDTYIYSALIDIEGTPEQRFLATFELYQKVLIEVEAQEGLGVF